MLNIKFFFLILLCIIIGCTHNNFPQSQRKNITLFEAIEIGKKELIKIDSSSWKKELLVEADTNNTAWNNYVRLSPSILDNKNIKKMELETKSCWVIYYAPKDYAGKGGDVFMFIDTSTGKVIGYLFGE